MELQLSIWVFSLWCTENERASPIYNAGTEMEYEVVKETKALSALSRRRGEPQQLIVDRHNALRRGVKPTASNMMKMEWCPQAARNAQNWANHCIYRHSPSNLRTTSELCGENLLMSFNPLSWPQVLQIWYNEERNFVYGSGGKTKWDVFGHYTQNLPSLECIITEPLSPLCGSNLELANIGPVSWFGE
ncbi:cysteine-rich secretory protein 2 isoform X3 [Turdus rufiventris]|nr:cysteine-rich secretory protein 2 isoform X3 [Turdus rufiventris]